MGIDAPARRRIHHRRQIMKLSKKYWIAAQLALLGLTTGGGASAAISSVNLGNYTLTGTYALPSSAPEASAITYNWDTGTFFVLGDEGDALVEVSKTGQQLSKMNLSNFNDTEGVTYVGNGQFVVTEERLRDAYKFTYASNGNANRTSLAAVDLGSTIGNIGIEGISYDPRTGTFVTVKEKDPQGVLSSQLNFGAPGGAQGTATTTSIFTPNLGVIDLSDVQVLAVVPSLLGTADEDNLLIISQESSLLLEVTRSGTVLSMFDLGLLTGNAEGVTIDPVTGKIYVVAEASFGLGDTSTLFELTPTAVPIPASLPLFGAALTGLVALRRRRAQ
jgi:uncharacterized protein YjiK